MATYIVAYQFARVSGNGSGFGNLTLEKKAAHKKNEQFYKDIRDYVRKALFAEYGDTIVVILNVMQCEED